MLTTPAPTNEQEEKEYLMKGIKERFQNDPQYAMIIILIGAGTTVAIMQASAKLIQATAYAHRAYAIKGATRAASAAARH